MPGGQEGPVLDHQDETDPAKRAMAIIDNVGGELGPEHPEASRTYKQIRGTARNANVAVDQ